MAYKKKFKKGLPIKSLEEILILYREKSFIFVHNRPYHHGWWNVWNLHYLSGLISKGTIFYAIKTGEK